jgi:omega-amidase
MKIALISLNQAWENKKENLLLCKKYLQIASCENTDLVVFPEMTLTGFSTNIELTYENFNHSETIKEFSSLAKTFNLGIIFGVVIKNGNNALNKAIFINKVGEVISDYSKVHPFSFAGEDKYFTPGKNISITKFEDVSIGLTICYDLRFPELYSALGREADVIINIANWPSKRMDHWETLLKARAIENQVFIIGVNRIGFDGNGLEYKESSNIFNANGEKLEFEKYDNMKIYNINTNWTKEFKTKFNTTDDRKVNFYKEIL